MKNSVLPRIKLPEGTTEAKLAYLANVKQPTLNNILHGKRRANPLVARALARVCEKRGIDLSIYDWLFPEDSSSPLIDKSVMMKKPEPQSAEGMF